MVKNKDRVKSPKGAPKQTTGPVDGLVTRDAKGHFVKGNAYQWPKGKSALPGGIPNGHHVTAREVLKLARENSLESIQTIIQIRDDESVPPLVRLKAAEAILDRAFGRPAVWVGDAGGAAAAVDEDGNAMSALLLAARLEPKKSKVIDSVAVERSEDQEQEADSIERAIREALEHRVPPAEVAKIVAASMRRPTPPSPTPESRYGQEAAPRPQAEPMAGEPAPAPTPEPEPEKAATEPPTPPRVNMPGFAEYHAQKQAERDRTAASKGVIKIIKETTAR